MVARDVAARDLGLAPRPGRVPALARLEPTLVERTTVLAMVRRVDQGAVVKCTATTTSVNMRKRPKRNARIRRGQRIEKRRNTGSDKRM